jgi:hypothetical protein
MSCYIQINSISGTSPFDIYLCDIGLYQCVFTQTETSPVYPVNVNIPTTLLGVSQIIIKIVDGNGCSTFQLHILPTPTPTPSVTPAPTPTPTPIF